MGDVHEGGSLGGEGRPELPSAMLASPSGSTSNPILIQGKMNGRDVEAAMQGANAFSPSNMTPRTLNHFDTENTGGVPLQTSWTFWVDK